MVMPYISRRNDTQLNRVRLRDGGAVRCRNAVRYFDRRALADFAEHISRIRPSAIVAANPYALMYSSLALRLSRQRVPLIATYHSSRFLGAKERVQMMIYRLFFWMADCAVFVCEKQSAFWLRRGVFSRRNEVIYNGVDTQEFCDRWSPEERRTLRSALGYSEGDYVIGISALLLRPEKNHCNWSRRSPCSAGRGIPARALMIGDGEMRGAVEARARELNVERDVVITGLQQEVRPYIAALRRRGVVQLYGSVFPGGDRGHGFEQTRGPFRGRRRSGDDRPGV